MAGPVKKQLTAGVTREPRQGAYAERRRPYPQDWTGPLCGSTAIRSIGSEEKCNHGNRCPTVEFKIHVHHDPATVGPLTEKPVQVREEQQNRNEYPYGVGDDRSEEHTSELQSLRHLV